MVKSAVVVAPGDNDYLLEAVRVLAIVFVFNGIVRGKRTLFIQVPTTFLPAVKTLLERSSSVEKVGTWS